MAVTDHDPIVDPCGTDCDHADCARLRQLDEDLDGHLDDVLVDVTDTDRDASDLLVVDRLLRAVARRRARMAAAQALADARVTEVRERNEAWLAKEQARNDTSWLESQLTAYHRARLDADPRAKSISLPSGTLKARKQPDQWVVDDEEMVICWASDACPEMLHPPKITIDRVAMKRVLKPVSEAGGDVGHPASGEVVPGVTFLPGEVAFRVETQ